MPIAIMPIANSYRIGNIRAYFDDYNSEYCLNKHLLKKEKMSKNFLFKYIICGAARCGVSFC